MASCGGDCTNFSASSARWFKLDAEGYDPAIRQWAADKLRANDNSWVSTIPAGLAPGQYLIRNEITPFDHTAILPKLHVKITGSGTKNPSDKDLVSIPGLYSDTVWPNIYSDFGTFAIPGPPPVTFGGDGGNSPPPATSAVTSARPTPTAGTTQVSVTSTTPTPVTSSPSAGHCLLKSRRLVRRLNKRH
ncbi:hypothetical protein DXG03_003240 [Asterophora parasitica]|uniref:lytic cellulose monooxygenase (C4-dehydrogenating) n=1 Tax=Asterophora parasitica TaxID=117018 RepID=A0A9P7KGG9_9AGAR|nr:hypothetical protein DXG03_003240 [Asterophora parasitica]